MLDDTNKLKRSKTKKNKFIEYDDVNNDNIYGIIAVPRDIDMQDGGTKICYKNQYISNKLYYINLLNNEDTQS